MGRRIEYVEQNVIVTYEELLNMKKYNEIAVDQLDDLSTLQQLADILSDVKPIFKMILKDAGLSTAPLTVATAMFNAYVNLAVGEVEGVKQILQNGYDSLEAIQNDMQPNGWTQVKMDIPWLEFVDEGLRAVQGNCFVSQYYKNGAWHNLNKLYT